MDATEVLCRLSQSESLRCSNDDRLLRRKSQNMEMYINKEKKNKEFPPPYLDLTLYLHHSNQHPQVIRFQIIFASHLIFARRMVNHSVPETYETFEGEGKKLC